MIDRFTRRGFLTMTVLGAMALTASNVLGTNTEERKRPNIILFITDDQDKESIGAYGGKTLSPNLDRMAREGILFHQVYVNTTVCTPSRYFFLTGRYAGRSYDGRYMEECPPGQQGFISFNVDLEDDNMNVGNILQQHGYTTGYVGKFHVGPDFKREEEMKKVGLKYVPKDAEVNEETSAAFKHNEQWYREYMKKYGFSWAKHIYWGNLNKPFEHHNPEWTIEAALEFIEQNKNNPFYLHYCTTLLHGPDKSWRVSMDHPEVSGEGLLDKLPDVMMDRKDMLERLKEKDLDPIEGHANNLWVDESIGAIYLKKIWKPSGERSESSCRVETLRLPDKSMSRSHRSKRLI